MCLLLLSHKYSTETFKSAFAGPKLGWWAVAPFQFAVCIGCVIANHVVAGQAMKVRACVFELERHAYLKLIAQDFMICIHG